MRVDLLHPGKDSKSILHTKISNQYLCDRLLIFFCEIQIKYTDSNFKNICLFFTCICMSSKLLWTYDTYEDSHMIIYTHVHTRSAAWTKHVCIICSVQHLDFRVRQRHCWFWVLWARETKDRREHVYLNTADFATWFLAHLFVTQSGAGWHDHVHRIVHGSGFNQSLSPAWGTQDVPFYIRHLNSVGCWNMYNYFREGVIVGVVWYKIYIYIMYLCNLMDSTSCDVFFSWEMRTSLDMCWRLVHPC